ncbi:hypothetical protein ANCDUO_27444, partial [Ancylostoma duodenale]
LNCYALNSVASEEDKDNFYSELEAVIRKEKSYYKYTCGDFNAVVENGSDGNWRLGRHGNEIRNDNGFRLLDLISANTEHTESMEVLENNSDLQERRQRGYRKLSSNRFVVHPIQTVHEDHTESFGCHTWESPNGQTHSEVDHILISRRWSLMDVTVLPSFVRGSDHRLLRAKIRLNEHIFKRDTHRGPPTRSPEYNETKQQKAMETYHWRKIENPTEDYEELVKGLTSCAKAAMESHGSKDERLDPKAKQLLRPRGEIKRDPNATHLEKITINKACRVAVKESLREH